MLLDRRNLRRTFRIAVIVGTVLFLINQVDVVLSGDATPETWAKIVLTYVVPFITANLGVLHGTRGSEVDAANVSSGTTGGA